MLFSTRQVAARISPFDLTGFLVVNLSGSLVPDRLENVSENLSHSLLYLKSLENVYHYSFFSTRQVAACMSSFDLTGYLAANLSGSLVPDRLENVSENL